ASALAIGAIRAGEKFAPPERAGELQMPSVLADIRTGARALRGAPAAIRLIAADVLASAVYGMLTVTLVLVSRKVGAGSGGYGLLLAGFGVGGVIGACVTARLVAPSSWRSHLAVGGAAVLTSGALLVSRPLDVTPAGTAPVPALG